MAKSQLVAEPGKQEIVMTRIIDGPIEKVFNCFIDPELVPQWWGSGTGKTEIDVFEPKVGGSWRLVETADGEEYAFHGVFHAIEKNKQIVQTFEFEGIPGHVLMETMTFEEVDGKTKITDQSVFQSVADRDGMLESGMETGADFGFDQIEKLVKG